MMQLTLVVNPASAAHPSDIADLHLRGHHLDETTIKIQLDTLRDRCQTAPQCVPLDFVVLASAVYCGDKMVNRELYAPDAWTRRMELSIPVSNPVEWRKAATELQEAISFLTGDYWDISFSQLSGPLYRPKTAPTYRRRRHRPAQKVRGDVVCLLSGGLDSLIGAIDWLEENPNGNLLAVGHHDQHVKGPFGDQNSLLDLLKAEYPNRVDALQVHVGQSPKGDETSFRSRSLLFLSLGLHAAYSLGPNVPLLVPENGTIAINIPLTPSRRGSCSTRTTHPFFLKHLMQALQSIGISNSVDNPLAYKTKGECVIQCRNQVLLARSVGKTVSCAKSGHKSTWLREANGCGRCVPCLFRRASLYVGGLDTEPYGLNVCDHNEVPIGNRGMLANDFRALLAFLRAQYTVSDIERILVASGGLALPEVIAYAQLVHRAIIEVGTWLKAKGDSTVKSWL